MILWLNPILSSVPPCLTQSPSKLTPNYHSCLANSTVSVSHRPKRRCDFYDLHKELVPYAEAWSWQNAIVKEKKALSENNEDLADSLIILQHHPVYTLGAGSSEVYLNFDVKNAPFDLYRTERGGEVTYHGPGQVQVQEGKPVDSNSLHLCRGRNIDLALEALEEMGQNGILADSSDIVELMQVSKDMTVLKAGDRIYGYILKFSSSFSVSIFNKLMEMYFKLGETKRAGRVFQQMACKSLDYWNTTITSLAENGQRTSSSSSFLPNGEMGSNQMTVHASVV